MKWNWIAQSENYLAIETDHPSSVPTGAGFLCPNRIPNSKTANVFLAVKRQKPEAESFLSRDEFQTASRFAFTQAVHLRIAVWLLSECIQTWRLQPHARYF